MKSWQLEEKANGMNEPHPQGVTASEKKDRLRVKYINNLHVWNQW